MYWFSRIASPDFIKGHKLRSVNSPLKLLVKHNSYDLDFRFYRTGVVYTLFSENRLTLDYQTAKSMKVAEVDIVGSCNGIFCVVDKEMIFTLWNPSIRRKLTIPIPLNYIEKGRDFALGFGVDPITDDYKIVMISYSKTGPMVYSMKTGTWSLINSPTMPFKKVMLRACLVNGTLYWVVERNPTGVCIMTFDLSTNVCGSIELPGPCFVTTKLTIVRDSLAAFCPEWVNDWIWVKRERNNSASCSRVVGSLTWLLTHQPVSRVLQLTEGDFLLYIYKLGLTLYIPESRKSSFPCSYISNIIDMETYAESLVLLDRGIICKGTQQSCDVEAKTNGRKRKLMY